MSNKADSLGLHLYNLNVNKIKLMKITSKIKKKDSEVSANNNRKELRSQWFLNGGVSICGDLTVN